MKSTISQIHHSRYMESFNNFRFQKQRRGEQGKGTTAGKGNRGDRLYMFANRQSRGRKQRSRGGGHTDLGRRPAGRSFWRRRRRDRRGGARPAGTSSSRRKETGGEQRRRRVLPGGEEARRRDLLPGEQRSRRDLLPGGGRGRGEYDFLSPSPPYPSPAQQRAAFSRAWSSARALARGAILSRAMARVARLARFCAA